MDNPTLNVKCPSCGGYVHPIDRQRSTTLHVWRTCRRCRTRWYVKVTPLGGDGTMHKVEWTDKRAIEAEWEGA